MNTSELIIHPVPTNKDTLIVGAVAGLTAGAAMALWGMLTSVYHGMGLLSFFEMIGGTFMGADAHVSGWGPALYGLLLHAGMSAGMGVLFTALLPQNATRRQATAAGIGFAFALLLAMTFVVTPTVNPVMRDLVATLPKSWLIQHTIFGMTLGYVPIYWRLYHDELVRVRLSGGPAVAH